MAGDSVYPRSMRVDLPPLPPQPQRPVNVFTHYTHKLAWQAGERQKRRALRWAWIKRRLTAPVLLPPLFAVLALAAVNAPGFPLPTDGSAEGVPIRPACVLAAAGWGLIVGWLLGLPNGGRKLGRALRGEPLDAEEVQSLRGRAQ